MIMISIGIIAYGLLSSVVYVEVMKVDSPPAPSMKGKLVGAVLYR